MKILFLQKILKGIFSKESNIEQSKKLDSLVLEVKIKQKTLELLKYDKKILEIKNEQLEEES